VTSAPLASPDGVSFRRSARLLGALGAFISLACATVVGVGIADLADRRFASGLWLMLGALGARWLLATVLGQWSDFAGSAVRARWRATLPGHLTRPRREGDRARGDLATAIDHASEGPSLELLAVSAVTSMTGLAILFWAGGWLCFTITASLLVLAAPLYQRAGRRSESMAVEFEERRALLERRQLELLQHTTELRALGAVPYGANEIAAISDSEHVIALRAIRIALESSLVTEFLSGVSIGLVAMVVGFALLGGRLTLAHALIAVLITSEIFTNVRRYGVEFHRRENAQRSLAALSESPPIRDGTTSRSLLEASELVTEANDASISVSLHATQRLLITGPSGSGKTTLVDTLLQWRTPRHGVVTRTSAAIGHVSVDSALLSGSLRENLTLGVAMDDQRVVQCLATLGLEGSRFEELDTVLLADGRGMSSGERVRLILARCLLANPVLLVIDDIGGVLDGESRRLVASALGNLTALAVIEATVDSPLLADVDQRIELQ
jgi:ATP-binding cassette, subfamily C, bacterial CydD